MVHFQWHSHCFRYLPKTAGPAVAGLLVELPAALVLGDLAAIPIAGSVEVRAAEQSGGREAAATVLVARAQH